MTTPPTILANGVTLANVGQAVESSFAVGAPLALTIADTTGYTSFAWVVMARPFGSVARLSDPSGYTSSLTPDIAGAYKIRGITNGGAARRDVEVIVVRSLGRAIRKAKTSDRLADVIGKFNALADEMDLSARVYNVKAYGAVGDGTTDDAAAIQAAIDAAAVAGGTVLIPAGTHTLNGQLTIPSGVTLAGEGAGVTILDFSGGTSFDDDACIYAAGSLTELGALTTVAADASAVVIASGADALVAGDVLVIYNATDSSFNTARTYYRAGEFVRVKSVSGTTVNLTEPLVAGYTSGANIHVYKVTPARVGVSGLTVRAPLAASAEVAGIAVALGVDVSIDRVETRDGALGGVMLERCYEVAISGLRAFEKDTDVGQNYGLALVNCQRVTVSDSRLVATRHGLTLGGSGSSGCVPNRQVQVTNCVISSHSTTDAGVDVHGNSEDVHIAGCILPRGAHLGGDRVTLADCDLSTAYATGVAVHLSEVLGFDFAVTDCQIRARADIATALLGLITVGDTDYPARSGGCLRIVGNDLAMGAYTGNAVFVSHSGTAAIDVEIAGNKARCSASAPSDTRLLVRADSGKGFKRVRVADNTLVGVGIALAGVNAELVVLADNVIDGSLCGGISKSANATPLRTSELVVVRGNAVRGSHGCGIYISGESNTFSLLDVGGNTAVSCALGGFAYTGDSSQTSSCYVAKALTATLRDNTFGDVQAVPTQLKMWAAYDIGTLVVGDNTRVGTVSAVNVLSVTTELYGYTDRGTLRESWGTAAPASGAWLVGERVWNRTPAAGGDLGWVCTTAGSPGTWKAFGGIAP